jgi:hypothetical protein
MRTRISWLAVLAVVTIILWQEPPPARAQEGQNNEYEVPPPPVFLPFPFGRPHMEQGGFYFSAEFEYYKQTNPLLSQPIAFRGLNDTDGTIGPVLGMQSIPGAFIGSHLDALDVNYVSGPGTWQPGYAATIGYRFADGIAVEAKWLHLYETHYAASATLAPAGSIGGNAADSFLTSPVYNYNPAFLGPGDQTGLGSNVATLGIWDASSVQEELFTQRTDIYEINFRIPIQETENWRTYGLVGPRLVALWENFKWTTVTPELDGNTPPNDVANYSNIVSNRLYGVHIGCGNEWELGDTPAGAFALSIDAQAALYIDFAHTIASYELGDKSTAASHGRFFNTIVPGLEGVVNFWYYPWEGVVLRLGYNALAFFNTVLSPRPVDFDMGTISPGYNQTQFRLLDGFQAGIGFIF